MGRWLATRARAWTGMYLIKGRILGVGVKSWFSAAGNVVQSIRFGECKETDPGTSRAIPALLEKGCHHYTLPSVGNNYIGCCQYTNRGAMVTTQHPLGCSECHTK